jgi:hypothetical protein
MNFATFLYTEFYTFLCYFQPSSSLFSGSAKVDFENVTHFCNITLVCAFVKRVTPVASGEYRWKVRFLYEFDYAKPNAGSQSAILTQAQNSVTKSELNYHVSIGISARKCILCSNFKFSLQEHN